MNISLLTFSPTGQSKACSLAVAKATKLEFTEYDVTHLSERKKPLHLEDTTLIISFPVYAGRVPSLFVDYIKEKLTCSHCKALVIATFGNRAFEDALVEMEDLLKAKAVSLIGSASIGCQHSYTDKVGSCRPDIEDFQILDRLAVYLNGETKETVAPGNRPYREGIVPADPPFMPTVREEGITIDKKCYAVCPTGALGRQDPKLCIHCCACIQVSKNDLVMDNPMFMSFVQRLEENCQQRVKSELYLP